MLKKLFLIKALFIACFSLSSLEAIEVLPEARAAYYHATDRHFRDIYSETGLYSIETSVEAWNRIYPWASLGFLYTSGSSEGEGDSTELYMIPIGLGAKYIFDLDWFQPYLGLGMVVAYSHIHNQSKYVAQHQSEWGVGGIAKSGFLAYLTKNVFLDIFCDYTYLKVTFDDSGKNTSNRRADLSGVYIGGGVGYRF